VGKGLTSSARVTPDGRISITLDLKNKLPDLPQGYANPVQEFAVDEKAYGNPPRINIVIMIVGSRGPPMALTLSSCNSRLTSPFTGTGDVQPFLALGKGLVRCGHRVRIATHETFRSFVKDASLEFFNIGGEPKDLMSYMVKSKFT
jgi:sterol 3beta-glucosyltransferase